MADVFVSYKAEDRPRVAPLVVALEQEGLSVWWDAQIAGGEHWREAIQEQLDAARCVMVVWSHRSVAPEGRFVRDEATRAQRRDVYLPVRIDPVEPPLGFGETQALTLIGWKGDLQAPQWQQTTAAIHAVLAHKPRPLVRGPHGLAHPARRRVLIAGGSAMLLAGGGAGWWLARGGAGVGNRLAVLPFANLSGDPGQAYLCDGLAEELRSALAHIPTLQVIARISSEAVRGLDATAAASKLGVGDVLTGSLRHANGLVRISAQLVAGNTGIERWSESYDRPDRDTLSVQTEIATRVAAALSAALGGKTVGTVNPAGTSSAAAHDLYLRGRALNTGSDDEASIRQAQGLAEAALALDPHYANAQALKAGIMATLAIFFTSKTQQPGAIDAALAAARHAVALNPTLADGHITTAFLLKSRLDFRGAIVSYERADALGANAGALVAYAFFLAEMGHAGEAIKGAERAVAIDPLNPESYSALGDTRYFARDYDGAITALRRMQQLAPGRFYARYFIGLALMWLGRTSEALKEFAAMPAGDAFRVAGEAVTQARAGHLTESERAVATLSADEQPILLAGILTQQGKGEAAMTLIERAFAAHDPDISGIRADRLYDPLRGDPRFKAIIAKLDFP